MSNENREYTFFWLIENYSYVWHKRGESLHSPVFCADGLKRTAWTLQLYPRGVFVGGKNRIYIRLCRNEDDGPVLVDMNYIISIVGDSGSALFSKILTSSFSKRFEGSGQFFTNILENLTKQGAVYLPKDILTVRCKLWMEKGNIDKVAPILGRTRIGIEHVSFIHEVENFSKDEQITRRIQVRCRSKEKWVIESNLYFADDISKRRVVVEIKPPGNDQIIADCKISLLDVSRNVIKCDEKDTRFDVERKCTQELSLTKDLIMSKQSEYLLEDKLSLLCDCTISTGIEFQLIDGAQNETGTKGKVSLSCNLHIKNSNISSEKLIVCPGIVDDFKEIYNGKFLTDVVLKTKSNSFPAHKVVLCARSPVFKVMMSSDMKEKNSGSIPVDDLEDDTVQQLLLFLYTDNLDDLQWESASKLYYAADKYQIEKLRLICSSFLIDNLTTSTATELLLLADIHSDFDLKKVVEHFILDNEVQVFRSVEWEKFMKVNPQLALETMHLKYKIKMK